MKHPLVSGPDLRAHQDPYDDVYIVEVPFHGAPRRVLQGLTSQSAGTLNLLLPPILRDAGPSLPAAYREQVELLADVMLALSEGLCEQVGLRRWRSATLSAARRGSTEQDYQPRSIRSRRELRRETRRLEERSGWRTVTP